MKNVNLASALTLAGLGACTVGPDYEVPLVESADGFGMWAGAEVTADAQEVSLATWWDVFQDAQLTGLVERGLAHNLDLKAAVARIEQSRARTRSELGSGGPSLDIEANRIQSRQSGAINPFFAGEDRIVSSLGATLSWEADLFGRIERRVESAEAEQQGAVEDLRDLQAALAADIARAYVDLRTAQLRLRIAEQNLDSQRVQLEIVERRVAAGSAAEIERAQAAALVASTASDVPQQRSAIRSAVLRLCVLTGAHDEELRRQLELNAALPPVPGSLQVGVPRDVLLRRPDVRRAERTLAARTADVGVATAALYPDISWSGRFGFDGLDVDDLIDAGNRAWSFGPTLRWNPFANGRIRADIAAAEYGVEEARVQFEATVLQAIADVEDGIQSFVQERLRRDALDQAVAEARRAMQRSEQRYRSGAADQLEVLDAQRTLFSYEDRLAASRAALLGAVIDVYRAVGGGWGEPEGLPAADD